MAATTMWPRRALALFVLALAAAGVLAAEPKRAPATTVRERLTKTMRGETGDRSVKERAKSDAD